MEAATGKPHGQAGQYLRNHFKDGYHGISYVKLKGLVRGGNSINFLSFNHAVKMLMKLQRDKHKWDLNGMIVILKAHPAFINGQV